MGLDVELQDEAGNVLHAIEDPQNLLGPLLPEDEENFPMLASIDLFGNTVFNRVQMTRLLGELESVSAQAESVAERSLLEAVRSMAARCSREVHLYLKFIGD